MTTKKHVQKAKREPKLRLHKHTGQGYVALNGRLIYLGRYDAKETRQAYHRTLAEWHANDKTIPVAPEEITVTELCALYLPWAEKHYRRPNGSATGTIECVKTAIARLEQLYGETPANSFGPKALRAVRGTWITEKLARSTVKMYSAAVKRIFKWAVAEEIVSLDLYHGLLCVEALEVGRSDARETAKVVPVPIEDVNAIQEFASRQVWAIIQLQLLTAARPGELCGLRSADIDQSGNIWTATLADHKTAHRGRERTLYFGPQAQAIMRPFLLRAPEAYLFSPREAEAERYAKCGKHRHQPTADSKTEREIRDCYDARTYAQAIGYAIEKCNAKARAEERKEIAPWSPYRLRHNAATAIRKQHGLEMAAVILGHAKCDVTQVYAEVNRERAMQLVAQIG